MKKKIPVVKEIDLSIRNIINSELTTIVIQNLRRQSENSPCKGCLIDSTCVKLCELASMEFSKTFIFKL